MISGRPDSGHATPRRDREQHHTSRPPSRVLAREEDKTHHDAVGYGGRSHRGTHGLAGTRGARHVVAPSHRASVRRHTIRPRAAGALLTLTTGTPRRGLL